MAIINTNTQEGRRILQGIQSGEVKYTGRGYGFEVSGASRSMRQSEVSATLKTRDFIRGLQGD